MDASIHFNQFEEKEIVHIPHTQMHVHMYKCTTGWFMRFLGKSKIENK